MRKMMRARANEKDDGALKVKSYNFKRIGLLTFNFVTFLTCTFSTWQFNQINQRRRVKSPIFQGLVTDKRSPRDGNLSEIIGTYDPKKRVKTAR